MQELMIEAMITPGICGPLVTIELPYQPSSPPISWLFFHMTLRLMPGWASTVLYKLQIELKHINWEFLQIWKKYCTVLFSLTWPSQSSVSGVSSKPNMRMKDLASTSTEFSTVLGCNKKRYYCTCKVKAWWCILTLHKKSFVHMKKQHANEVNC